MNTTSINQQFKEDEITYIKRWDREKNEYVSIPYPKIGGRLRMAHESNETLSIETEIIRYDGQLAVVIALCGTSKGNFKGIGMASVERDEKIAPAILELAETRAIARALRFAGYGIEFCSAEEISHLGSEDNFNGYSNKAQNKVNYHREHGSEIPQNGSETKVQGNHTQPDSNGSEKGRLSSKQYRYIHKLNEELGKSPADLDKLCLSMFGTVSQHLSKGDASRIIHHLTGHQQNQFRMSA